MVLETAEGQGWTRTNRKLLEELLPFYTSSLASKGSCKWNVVSKFSKRKVWTKRQHSAEVTQKVLLSAANCSTAMVKEEESAAALQQNTSDTNWHQAHTCLQTVRQQLFQIKRNVTIQWIHNLTFLWDLNWEKFVMQEIWDWDYWHEVIDITDFEVTETERELAALKDTVGSHGCLLLPVLMLAHQCGHCCQTFQM